MAEYILPLLVGIVANICAIHLLSKFLHKKPAFRPAVISVMAIVVSAVMVFINTFQIPWLNTASLYVLYTLMAYILFKGNLALKFGFSVIMTTINVVSELMLAFFILIISELRLNEITEDSLIFNIIGSLSVIIFVILGRGAAKLFPRKYETFRLNDMYLITFQILATCALFVIAQFSQEARLSFGVNLLIMLLQISFLASSVLVFFIFDSALHKRELETQVDFYKYQFGQTKASQELIGKIEHDMEKHLLALNLDLKNDRTEDAVRKINELIGNLNAAGGVANSANADFDAIINYKAKQAQVYGITVACELRLPYTLRMNTTDLAVILGNALDNAIEACKAAERMESVIHLSVEYEKSNLYIMLRNPYDGDVRMDATREFATRKKDGRHGIGLKSIKETVDKYDGVMDISTEDGAFVLKVVLFNLLNT